MPQDESHFTCALCKQTFPKGWTDDEAMAEFKENFPRTPPEFATQVCDGCYQELKKGCN